MNQTSNSTENVRAIYINTFTTILNEFNKENIRYVVLRNFEFLLNPTAPLERHLDITIHKDDMHHARDILKKCGAKRYPKNFNFSRAHQGMGILIKKHNVKVGFDIQNNGVYWNDILYLSAEQIMKKRKKVGIVHTLSDSDAFIMYVCHSILGKRMFKKKYREKIKTMVQIIDIKTVKEELSLIFNKKIANKIIENIKNNQFKKIEKKAYSYAAYFILKNPHNVPDFAKLTLRWFFTPKYCPLRKVPLLRYLVPSRPLIAFIGPDGAGKSTAVKTLQKTLEKHNVKAEVVYMGRGNANVLPLRKIGDNVKKMEPQSKIKKKILYTMAAPLYTIDLVLRYAINIFPKRKKETIVITDRYCSDILLMKHVPLWLKKGLITIFPQPTFTFYLYNNPHTLYDRRQSQSPKELERQMDLFKILGKKYKGILVKTTTEEQSNQDITEHTLKRLMDLTLF